MPYLAFAAVGALCAAEGPRLKRRGYSRVTPIWVLIVAPRITRYLAINQNQRINEPTSKTIGTYVRTHHTGRPSRRKVAMKTLWADCERAKRLD
jgi:hypothetical protein